MPNRYLAELRDDDEPTKRALLMAQAVAQHLRDLEGDDPGDDPASDALIASAELLAATLVTQLRALTRKR